VTVHLEVLHVPDCPNLGALLQRLRQVTDLPITTREITTNTAAVMVGMAGSPTLLINDEDPFTTTDRPAGGLSCRIYRDEYGHPTPAPTPAQLRAVLSSARTAQLGMAEPGEPLRAWRTRALPVAPVEKAVHQAILRSFGSSGHPPSAAEIDLLATGFGRDSAEVLRALHNLDAIRLDTQGQIAVAYPFSTRPTRHRVRIANRVEVYAMCAIDALGVAPMLDQDTRIDSTDATSGRPVSLTTTAGRTSWDPTGAVVFVGSVASRGPSADTCCDYLNFFADDAAAKAWTAAHPEVPGQILTQKLAETLAVRLFEPLLRDN
jgi:hypothetical protein